MILIHKAIPCDDCEHGVYLPYGYYDNYFESKVHALTVLECPECGNRINEEIYHEDGEAWGMIKTMLIEAGYVVNIDDTPLQ